MAEIAIPVADPYRTGARVQLFRGVGSCKTKINDSATFFNAYYSLNVGGGGGLSGFPHKAFVKTILNHLNLIKTTLEGQGAKKKFEIIFKLRD